MGREYFSLSPYPWPRYFRPVRGEETKPMHEQEGVRVPVSLVDVFYVQEQPKSSTHLVAVVGCLGGALDVRSEADWSELPTEVGNDITALHASRRGEFRSIIGKCVDIFSLDAMDQSLQAPHFNDTVNMYSVAHARINVSEQGLTVDLLANRGNLSVGRLDLLSSYVLGTKTALSDIRNTDRELFHFFVPTGSVLDVREGKGMGLVYPVLDANVDRPSSSYASMRIAYDLLLAAQHDVSGVIPHHKFVENELPVPNRDMVEMQLESEGYVIDGDVARRAGAHTPTAGENKLLSVLRRMRAGWATEEITLPNQASTEDYCEAVNLLLSQFTQSQDIEAQQALASRVVLSMQPIAGSEVIVPQVKKPALPSKTAQVKKSTWEGSFDSIESPNVSKQGEWWGEFRAKNADENKRYASTSADWTTVSHSKTWNGNFS